jgi:hypothetical protein
VTGPPDEGTREPRPGDRDVRSLASLVRGEAVRTDAVERIQPDPARIAAGWERRFVIERARTADLVTLYEQGGFDVVLDPVAPELLSDECTDCRLVAALDYVQVYTRKRATP